jgi:UDP-glucose 4-epimerase
MVSKILVTGGAGYIGSHTVLALLRSGYNVVVIDNLCNSSAESLNRVAKIADREALFIEGDVRKRDFLDAVLAKHKISAVLHFAGLKAVGESVTQPLCYYENNVHGSQILLQAMENAGIFNIVFSSSATVYGDPAVVPISESAALGPTNPYGRTKLMVEDMLRDLAIADPRWHIAILRYFNPVGAHESGLIGEDPNGIPSNLLPFITQVAVGKLQQLSVFGKDYSTPDGTGVRDYIHVVDLAEGHLSALEAIKSRTGAHVWNLGTGQGYSVLEMVRAFEEVSGCVVPYRIAPRRSGDIAVCYADPSKAASELGWKAKRGLPKMMWDAWCWQSMNPNGYQ